MLVEETTNVLYGPFVPNIRIRLEPEFHKKWKALLDARGIKQTRALIGTIKWLLAQPAKVQNVVFGQSPEEDHINTLKLVLKELEAKEKGRRK